MTHGTQEATTSRGDPEVELTSDEGKKWVAWIPRICGYVLFLSAWTVASGTIIDEFILPSPFGLLHEMRDILTGGILWSNLGATLLRVVIGFSIAYVLGAALGILMRRRWWDGFFGGWVVAVLNTPGLVFALVATMIFGFSSIGPLIAVVVTTMPFITVNVVEGVRARPQELDEMAHVYAVSNAHRLRHVILPFLAPYLFSAARYGFSIAWKMSALTELFGGSKGIGFQTLRAYQAFDVPAFLAWIAYFAILTLILERLILQSAMRRFFRWRDADV